jgi:hypothetical protein
MSIAVADAIPELTAWQEVFPASVTVTRTSEEDFKSRQVNVWIDGERAASLLWGDSITRELQPGAHRIRLSNTLVWKNIDFTIRPGQQVFFEVINRMGLGTISLILILGVGPLYLTVRRMDV